MNRTLEAIFRRPLRLLIMLLLLPIVGVTIGFFLPRAYESTATLWATRRYEIIGSTGSESNLLATPAQTQATAMTELLQSHTFALDVANITDLPSTIPPGDTQARENALFEEVSQNVYVSVVGTNSYIITYSHENAQIAQQVVDAVIEHFATQSQTFSVIEAQRQVQILKSQLPAANEEAQVAAEAVNEYRAAHPNLSPTDLENDAQYQLLNTQAETTRGNVQSIQAEITRLNQAISSQGEGASNGEGLFRIVDAPIAPTRPASLTRQLLIAGGAGLGVALLAITIYLVILIRRDRAIYTIQDLQKITMLPVALQIPQLNKPALSLLTTTSSNPPVKSEK